MKIILPIFILILAGNAVFAQTTKAGEIRIIILKDEGGFGVDKGFEISLEKGDLATFHGGQNFYGRKGNYRGAFDEKQFLELARLIIKNNFFALKNRYEGNTMDVGTRTITVGYGGKQKSVVNWGASRQKEFAAIEKAVKELEAKIKWRAEANQTSALKENAASQFFTGKLAGRMIEMRLQFNGDAATGEYRYYGGKGALQLKGKRQSDKKLTLEEFDQSNKKTGAFDCDIEYNAQEADTTLSCGWQNPRGGEPITVFLNQQHIEFTNNLQIATKIISEKKLGIDAAYPQITGGASAAIAKFNARIAALTLKGIRDYKRDYEPTPDKSVYELDYKILLATNDFISVEFSESAFAGGAYPNAAYHTVNFDLRGAGRELSLSELFKPKSNFQAAIAKSSLASINKAMKNNEAEDLPADMVSSVEKWAITRRGIVVYYDFPHVIFALSRVFVPFAALEEKLNPNGAAMSLRKN
ncbi:MAG: DUF4163 domain-containing protein [Pyrinomonadaceae bacterium]|nr:DUF4163 domain-containing protein [Pyrinomonadaceae bacterium]